MVEVNLPYPKQRSFIGKGKVAEIKELIKQLHVATLIITHTVNDGQHLRLNQDLNVKIIDYAGLILTIFARRAQTAEGKLQVELAQEIYGRAKLRGAWTHLERQRGGLGATGGPGERQIELDRRLINRRIKQLRKKIDKRKKHVDLVSLQRKKHVPMVTLVGYTNAGKSSLFARLTKAAVSSSSRLFETLDTTTRKLHLDLHHDVILSDTVGFIRNLPHELVDAFKSTLNEVVVADLLLVVLDINDDELYNKYQIIQNTLQIIGAAEIPQVIVLNKIDLAPDELGLNSNFWVKIPIFKLSAHTGMGVNRLREFLCEHFSSSNPVSLLNKQSVISPKQ